MTTVGAIIGGLGAALTPIWTLRLLERIDSRASRLSTALLSMVLFSICVYIAFNQPLYGSIAFVGALFSVTILKRTSLARRAPVDFVVEEPLLDQAVSPEMAVELELLGEQFRRGEIPDTRSDALLDVPTAEQNPIDLWE